MKPVGYYNYTVIVPYLGLAAAVTGIALCFMGLPGWAVICLLIAGGSDMIDGKIASAKKDRTKDERSYGIQIDSLCDVISFGVLPAVIGYGYGITHWSYILVSILFVLAAVVRLGYYNVDEINRQNDPGSLRRETYLGLPVTLSAIIVPLVCFASGWAAGFAILYTVVLGLTAVAFIAPFRLPKPHGWGIGLMAAAGLAIVVGSVLLLV